MFNIKRMPIWKRRLFVALISVVALVFGIWWMHSTEDLIILMVFIAMGNLLPYHQPDESGNNKQ